MSDYYDGYYIGDAHKNECLCLECENPRLIKRIAELEAGAAEIANHWHYPAHNLDLDNLPEPGEIVVVYYRIAGLVVGPTIMTPVHADGPPTVAGVSIYQPIVRWCRIPEE